MKLVRILSIVIVSICFNGCSNNDDPKPVSVLVEATSVRTFSVSTLQSVLQASGIGFGLPIVKYDVEIFKVKYRTTYKNETIVASGLVILPLVSSTESVGMLSFQHGTEVAHADAPSLLTPEETIGNLYGALASLGFITVIADYIGFGESSDFAHPYYVEDATASAVIDNIKAAKELALSKNINFNEKLFLAGYSQGGYATLATHKTIEQNALDGFDLQASFPASGGYDVKGMQEYLFQLDTYEQPFYIAYVTHAYNDYYEWNEPYANFFQEPFASKIDTLFDGTRGGSDINAALTDTLDQLLQFDARADISQPKFTYLNNAFIENSLTDWAPTIPVFMYHGTADDTVPYQNSVDTYGALLAKGASSSVVSLTPIPGADHSSGVVPYIALVTSRLLQMK